nr:hypothetical protein Iba_chr13bCG11070 [Ipomoea batatas]
MDSSGDYCRSCYSGHLHMILSTYSEVLEWKGRSVTGGAI